MSSKIYNTILDVLNSHTGYAIGKKLHIDPSRINYYKRGEYKLENMPLDLVIKILDAYADVSITLKSE